MAGGCGRGGAAGGRSPCVRAVLRAQQGPVQDVPVPGPRDQALRRLLLPRGARRGRAGRADGRALVRAPLQDLQSRVHGPPAADPLCQPRRLRADERHRGDAGRRHGRRHRVGQTPHRAAPGEFARRERPRDRPRAGARLPVRHRHLRSAQGDVGRRDRVRALAALVRRGHGRVPVARTGRSEHRDVDARRRQPGDDARDQGPREPEGTSRTVGVRRCGPT